MIRFKFSKNVFVYKKRNICVTFFLFFLLKSQKNFDTGDRVRVTQVNKWTCVRACKLLSFKRLNHLNRSLSLRPSLSLTPLSHTSLTMWHLRVSSPHTPVFFQITFTDVFLLLWISCASKATSENVDDPDVSVSFPLSSHFSVVPIKVLKDLMLASLLASGLTLG